MAGAMLKGWIGAGEAPGRFQVVDPSHPDLPPGVNWHEGPPGEGFGDAVVQLGFKPQMLGDIAPGLAGAVGAETTLTSIMAGVELASLRAAFPDAGAIVRVMPNMPVAIGKGAVGLIAEDRAAPGVEEIGALAGKLGTAEWVADEALIHVLTALVGSGPAFVYRYIDALARGGERLGLDADVSRRLSLAMAEGASALAAGSGESPAALADRVASPGGTTRKGLDVLDDGEALAGVIGAALDAATARAREMAEEAKR
ncbi:pyrroline-5-carboxylate reductase [Parasphingopyxis sp. GrpM-11]|uniref:Pyrroline-5-carboxylate reductase n=2 Tax=Parasphingopyxis marina TaxID=2761622 RepID=A0A842I368_9SPHN|nr:pyrroline-5-carboxylate reductase [Parasphingopyxis marina]